MGIQDQQPPASHTYNFTGVKMEPECFALRYHKRPTGGIKKLKGGDGSHMSQVLGNWNPHMNPHVDNVSALMVYPSLSEI